MTTQHTPGPWTVDMESITATVRSTEGKAIARCYQGDEDARLIAAAPEMLAMLKLVVDSGLVERYGFSSLDICKLINKATGGSV